MGLCELIAYVFSRCFCSSVPCVVLSSFLLYSEGYVLVYNGVVVCLQWVVEEEFWYIFLRIHVM